MKRILLYLLLFTFSQKASSQNPTVYADSIFNLILDNRLIAFDSTKTPIPYQTIIDTYQHRDTSINCLWTRPKFIDNIYHASFDGILAAYTAPNFDTFVYKSSSKFISFFEKTYDNNGNYLGKKWAFMIDREMASRSFNNLQKSIRKDIQASKTFSKIVQVVQTKKNEKWVNESVEINGFVYPNDSCMSAYSLQLNNKFKFEQDYNKDYFCTTSSASYETVIGLEAETEDFLNYSERVQYYKIENKTGYWGIEKSDLNTISLVLYSKKGALLVKYDLQILSSNSIVLNVNQQKIFLRKIIQKE